MRQARSLGVACGALALAVGCGPPTLEVGTPFTVAFTGPSHGATGIAVDTDIRIGFNDPVEPQSARDNQKVTIDGDDVARSVLFFEGDTVLVLVPTRTLPNATAVRVEIGADVESASGVDLDAPLLIEFTTE